MRALGAEGVELGEAGVLGWQVPDHEEWVRELGVWLCYLGDGGLVGRFEKKCGE